MTRNTFAALAILAIVVTGTVSVQAAPVTCTASAGVPPIVRVEGTAEPVADYTLTCTGGVATAPGSPVPQMNFTIFFNSPFTTKTTPPAFTEALLLVDKP